MRTRRLDTNEERLSELRRNLELEVRQVEEATAASARLHRDPGDEADLASDGVDHEAGSRVLSVLVHNAEQVERALELLRGGLYGRCEDCGQEIPGERLQALPEATRCLNCQMLFDRSGAGRHSA